MQKKKILILGSKGFYGKNLKLFLRQKKIKVFTDIRYKKFLKTQKIKFFLNKILMNSKPDIIVNLVANTDVNFCEKNNFVAKKSNIFFTKILVQLIKKKKY